MRDSLGPLQTSLKGLLCHQGHLSRKCLGPGAGPQVPPGYQGTGCGQADSPEPTTPHPHMAAAPSPDRQRQSKTRPGPTRSLRPAPSAARVLGTEQTDPVSGGRVLPAGKGQGARHGSQAEVGSDPGRGPGGGRGGGRAHPQHRVTTGTPAHPRLQEHPLPRSPPGLPGPSTWPVSHRSPWLPDHQGAPSTPAPQELDSRGGVTSGVGPVSGATAQTPQSPTEHLGRSQPPGAPGGAGTHCLLDARLHVLTQQPVEDKGVSEPLGLEGRRRRSGRAGPRGRTGSARGAPETLHRARGTQC